MPIYQPEREAIVLAKVSEKNKGPLGPGAIPAISILRVSSNIGAVKIAYELGRSSHFEMLRRFGFGASTRSGFPEESAGLLRPWRSWKPSR